jgi:hypothetical protein
VSFPLLFFGGVRHGEREEKERKKDMVGLVNEPVGGLKVLLRAFLLQGSRRKAVAERHALPCGVSGFCFLFGSDVISLDYNYKLSLYNNYILDI